MTLKVGIAPMETTEETYLDPTIHYITTVIVP